MAQMTLGNRIAVTFAIVLAILFALALFGYLSGRWSDEAEGQPLQTSKFDQRLTELDKQALEEAYKAQVHLIFRNWMTEGLPPAHRAATGFRNSRKAYVDAMIEIEKREQAK